MPITDVVYFVLSNNKLFTKIRDFTRGHPLKNPHPLKRKKENKITNCKKIKVFLEGCCTVY